MAKTTVDLTDPAQKVKNEYVHLGLKNILSAGLMLFDKQSADGKLDAIAEANGLSHDETNAEKRKIVRSYVKELSLVKGGYSSHTKILSKEDSDLLSELRKILGPEKKKHRTNTG